MSRSWEVVMSPFREERSGARVGHVSGRRGKPSNNQLAPEMTAAMEQALRDQHADFGPTLAAEKLGEQEGLRVDADCVHR